MKYVNIGLLGLLLVGCVQADTPYRFKSEEIANPNYRLYRVIDTDLNVACYATYTSVSCVKL